MIRIGCAGTSGLGIIKGLQKAHDLKLKCLECEFTYGVNMNNATAKEAGELAKKLDIRLSVHVPYYINLNSEDKKKQEESKKRILESCERASYLGAKYVVFHPGFYGKSTPEQTFNAIKENILDLKEKINKNSWNVFLAPETMGKINVFGSLDEILKLVKETKCHFCIDFSHLLARSNGKMTYDEMCKKVSSFSELHSHFSGIEYGDKGEKNHILTPEKEIEVLGNALKKNKIENITIINESPDPFSDCVKTLKIFSKLKII
ncbi:MAG: TIM barrel protein [Candidatus Nanoarchaeia archaeon]|nr:TIM barrel protein [Candidatus Nanoarchaeia archaeon]MDD5588147.1 TIM barrel protein [Candidatus Nanoarchaeia archaeon]